MSSTTTSWIAAASVGAVEALKDQGICKWNHGLRSLQQHAKNNVAKSHSHDHAKRPVGSRPSSASVSKIIRDEKMKQSEDSLRTVMYLSCWGPNNWDPPSIIIIFVCVCIYMCTIRIFIFSSSNSDIFHICAILSTNSFVLLISSFFFSNQTHSKEVKGGRISR